jgi:RNA polymerase sigma factor (sigma-70 family)
MDGGNGASQVDLGVVVDLVSSGAGAFKATARRYSLCSQDAEDAYQRGVEILITKAPTADRAELRPWLHTVIKHEALAVRRQRERLLGGELPAEGAGTSPGPEEEAAERQRATRTAEALGGLKPGEVQCLLLKALGYSYDEIADRTGFTWTKVNRSLTEGRRRFFERFARIESGAQCRRLAPLLSAACDGETSSSQDRQITAHLRSCQSCRATLRHYRSAPRHLAELLPPVLALPALQRPGWLSRLCESVVAGTADRAGALSHKLQHAGELVSAQKTAAVVASTAALASSGVAAERAVRDHPDSRPRTVAEERGARDRHPAEAESAPPLPKPMPPGDARPAVPDAAKPAAAPREAAGEFDLPPDSAPAGDSSQALAAARDTSALGAGPPGAAVSDGEFDDGQGAAAGASAAGSAGGEFGP